MNTAIEFTDGPRATARPERRSCLRLSPARVVVLYALAMAWVESAVVFYMRSMIDRLVRGEGHDAGGDYQL